MAAHAARRPAKSGRKDPGGGTAERLRQPDPAAGAARRGVRRRLGRTVIGGLEGERAARRRLELERDATTARELGLHHGLALLLPIHGATTLWGES